MSVSPTSLSFGDVTVGQSKTKSITIANSSSSNERLYFTPGPPNSPFEVVGGQSTWVDPGQSKTYSVKFTPTNDQSYSQNLNITNNSTNKSDPHSVPMSGRGVDATSIIMSVSPTRSRWSPVPEDQ